MTSPSLANALASPGPAWVAPRIRADWRDTGAYAGDGTLDDLSDQAGDSYTVVQSMDDGLPDTVTVTTSADASGTLSLPDVVGRNATVVGAIRSDSTSGTAQFTDASAVGNTSTAGALPAAIANRVAGIGDLMWISWRPLTSGLGAAAQILQYPAGYSVLIPQTTDRDFSGIVLVRYAPKEINEPKPLIYFNMPVDWAAGLIPMRATGKISSADYMPIQFLSASGKVPTAYSNNHTSNTVAAGATGNSGGSPQGLYLSYGAGGVWTQVSGGKQFANTSTNGKINAGWAVNGPSGASTSYGAGFGNFTTTMGTTLPSGPSLQTIDGTFESGVTGWTPSGGTFAQSAAQAHSGTKSGLLTTTGSPTQSTFRNSANIGAIAAGSTYRTFGWARAGSAVANVQMSIDWYNASAVYISTTSSPAQTLVANTWTRLDTGPITAPVGAVSAQYGGTFFGSPVAGTAVFFDDVDFGGMESIVFSWSAEADEWPDLDARQYFSQFSTGSPISAYDRDIAPMSVQHGIITEDGPQYVQVFSGQMSAVSVASRTADIEGVSASRLALLGSVNLPMINGQAMGANMTWPVTHAFAWCGFYASPAPTQYARAYFSMHGSMYPNLGRAPLGQPEPTIIARYSDFAVTNAGGGSGQIDGYQPTDVPGPFVLGMNAWKQNNSGLMLQWQYRPDVMPWNPLVLNGAPPPVYDVLSQANGIGRFSCWLRGDVTTASLNYSISPFIGSFAGLFAHRITVKNGAGATTSYVEVGIEAGTPTTCFAYLVMADNSGHSPAQATAVLPIDGNWHFCSWSWNFATGAATFHIDDATFTLSTFTVVATDLPTTEAANDKAGGQTLCDMWSYLPVADCQLEAGPAALYSADYVWRPEVYASGVSVFNPSAIVRPVSLHLNAIVEAAPSAAWDLLVRYAQASLSSYRCDELDRPCFLPLTYFAEPVFTELASDFAGARTVSGGWGTSDGQTMLPWTTTPAGNTAVGSGVGQMTLTAASAIVEAAMLDIAAQDIDVRVICEPKVIAAGAPVNFDIRIRYVDSTHYVIARIAFQTDQSVRAAVIANYGAGEITLAFNNLTALTYDAGQVIWLRVFAYGSIVQLKTYNTQNIEPIGWTVTATDTAPTTGHVALQAFASAGNTNVPFTVWWDRFRARTEIVEVLDTEVNAQDLNITTDPSRIRNDATVQFSDTVVTTNAVQVLGYSTLVILPPKLTVITFTTDLTQAQTIANPIFYNLVVAEVTAGTLPPGRHWAAFNSKSDGSGSYLTGSSIVATVIGVTPTSVTVQFNNKSGTAIYMVNNNANGIPFMGVQGYAVTVNAGYTTVTDSASIARRGDRTVSSDIEGIQLRADATLVATQLVGISANPRGTVTVHVMGNPLRTPGQRVRIADAQGTGADGLWRILSVTHNRNLAEFTQDLTLVQILDTARWDVSDWDQAAWSE